MASDTQVRLRLCRSGSFVLSAHDPGRQRRTLLVSGSAGKLHVVAVDPVGFEEIVVLRRVGRRGVTLERSVLQGRLDGALEWSWGLERPGLHRHETWSVLPLARGTWQQTDIRPDRTTHYRREPDGVFSGTSTDVSGAGLWNSSWTVGAEGAGLQGRYSDANGRTLGSVTLTGIREGRFASWTGPVSEGFLEMSEDGETGDPSAPTGGTVHIVTKSRDGSNTDASRTYNPQGGYSEVGVRNSGDGMITSYVGWAHAGTLGSTQEGNGDSVVTFQFGTETDPAGGGWTTTSRIENRLDGSSSWDSTNVGPDNTKDSWFGSTDVGGNSSYSERIEYSDGSVRLVTRTTDKDGNGQEQNTLIDKDGNVVSDDTTPVGKDVPPPAPDDAATAQSDNKDPNAPQEPDQPEHPDTGGTAAGIPSDDGNVDDAPPVPRGLIGLGDPGGLRSFVSAALTGQPLDDDESMASGRVRQWRDRLGVAAEGDGSGIDDGVGQGIVIDMPLDPGPGTDGDWGDLTNPRALLNYAADLSSAMQGLAGAGNLLAGAAG